MKLVETNVINKIISNIISQKVDCQSFVNNYQRDKNKDFKDGMKKWIESCKQAND